MTTLAWAMLGMVLLLLVGGLMLLAQLRHDERLRLRIEEVQLRAELATGPDVVVAGLGGFLRVIAGIGEIIAHSGLLSSRTLTDLQVTLNMAGLRGKFAVRLFVGGKILLLLGLPGLTYLLMLQLHWWPSPWLAMVVGSGIIGLLAPDFIVRRRRGAYLRALDLGLPDALDMLVICSEAGLGLEAAFERVSNEIIHGHAVMGQEMRITLQEMRINSDRRAALLGLGRRTGLESLQRLGGTLVQTMQYGTPLSQTLRTLSLELRHETLLRFEGKAARLPVMLTVPMILFILPCVFLVVGGPAIVQVFQSFQK
jgi:tight adherence protein C